MPIYRVMRHHRSHSLCDTPAPPTFKTLSKTRINTAGADARRLLEHLARDHPGLLNGRQVQALRRILIQNYHWDGAGRLRWREDGDDSGLPPSAHRIVPAPARVTVTDVVVTEIDTSVGDVYEATAYAVWQALRVEHPVPYVGFSDPEMVASWLASMCGRRLDVVTEARYWREGKRESDAESLLHAWLFFEYAVPVGLHGRGDQLILATEDPYRSYGMGEYGETRVGPAQSPGVLSRFVGAQLTDGAVIVGQDGDAVCAGLVLRFDNGDLVVGTYCDEWVLAVGAVPAAIAHHWAVQPFVRGGSR